MGLRVAVPPAVEAVSVELAKAHAKVEHDAEDVLIAGYVKAARRLAESRTNRAIGVQTLELTADGFPAGRLPLELPRPPLVEVESVSYLDPAGASQILDPSSYRVVAGTPGLVAPAPGARWPRTLAGPAAVTVRYVAGWGPDDLPEDGRLALLMLAAHWINRREPTAIGTIVAELPDGVDDLLGSIDWRT